MYQSFAGKLKKQSFLFFVTLLVFSFFYVTTQQAPGSSDTYWHLSVGREIAGEGKIPTTDSFVYGPREKDFISTEAYAELLYFRLVSAFGLNSIYALRLVIGLGIIILLYLTFRKITTEDIIINAVLAVVGYTIAVRLLLDRPESLSFLFIAITNFICLNYFLTKKVTYFSYILPVVFLLWPQTHPYSIVGLMLVIFWGCIFLFEGFRNQTKTVYPFKITFLLIVSSIFSIVQYKQTFYALNTVSEPLVQNITEFMTVFQRLKAIKYGFLSQVPIEIYVFLAVLVVFIFLFLTMLKSKEKTIVCIITSAFYLILYVSAFRYLRQIPLVVILSSPWILYMYKTYAIDSIKNMGKYVFSGIYLLTISLALGSILLGHVIQSRHFWRFIQNNEGQSIAVRNLNWNTEFPYTIPDVINSNISSKRILTFQIWNNYFIWSVPGAKTFSDSLWDYRTAGDLKDEETLNAGIGNWQELIKTYNIDTVVNSQYDSIFDNLTPVYTLSNWKLVYINSDAAVYAREDVIKKLPVDLSKIQAQYAYYPLNLSFDIKDQDQAVKQLQDLLAYDNKNAFARSQLILYLLNNKNDIDAATKLTIQSRNLIPKDPIFSFYMAAIYTRGNKCNLALDFAREMKQKSYGDFNFTQSANAELSKCSMSL